jgi:hypothetical protein
MLISELGWPLIMYRFIIRQQVRNPKAARYSMCHPCKVEAPLVKDIGVTTSSLASINQAQVEHTLRLSGAMTLIAIPEPVLRATGSMLMP